MVCHRGHSRGVPSPEPTATHSQHTGLVACASQRHCLPSGFLVVFEKPNRSSFTFTYTTPPTGPLLLYVCMGTGLRTSFWKATGLMAQGGTGYPGDTFAMPTLRSSCRNWRRGNGGRERGTGQGSNGTRDGYHEHTDPAPR